MKLKYKKVILLTTMSTMGIGLLTLSISQDRPRAEKNSNAAFNNPAAVAMADSDNTTTDTDNITSEPTLSPLPTMTTAPSPTPTPSPVHDLKSGDKKLDALFEDYYAAKILCDVSKLRSMTTDPSAVETAEELQQEVGYIEDYRNIKSYYKEGLEDGTYIVYVYSDVKLIGVNTLAPKLAKSYVVTDDQGNYKIFTGKVDADLEAYYNARNDDKDVQKLINETNKKFDEAKKKDEDLSKYVKILDGLVKDDGNKSN